MNTRLQVEHPVTEEITGVDLVQAQIRIAAGERLWFTQDDLSITGHAIEVRINAEDPDDGFRPGPGTLSKLVPPTGDRVRWDAAVLEGSRISPYYDSMVAKLITWAPDRAAAIDKTLAALDELVVDGVPTTKSLHQAVLSAPDFRAGDLRVGIIPGRPDLSESAV